MLNLKAGIFPIKLLPFNAHIANCFGRRPNKDNVFFLASFGKFNVFRQKPISWMNGLAIRLSGHIEQFLAFQIALRGRGRADFISFICLKNSIVSSFWINLDTFQHTNQCHMQGIFISLTVNCNCSNPQPLRGLYYSAGYFTSICYKQLINMSEGALQAERA